MVGHFSITLDLKGRRKTATKLKGKEAAKRKKAAAKGKTKKEKCNLRPNRTSSLSKLPRHSN